MTSVIMRVAENWQTGELGLKIVGIPDFNGVFYATQGRLVAHDLLEHVNGLKKIGSIDDEIEALGACWEVRGRHGVLAKDMSGYYSPEESLSYDLVNLWGYFKDGVEFRTPVPVTRVSSNTDEHAIASIVDFFSHNREEPGAEEEFARLKQFKKAAPHFLRRGMRKAVKKYGDGVWALDFFWKMADEIDHAVFRDDLYEGSEYKLTYSYQSGKVIVEQVFGDFDY